MEFDFDSRLEQIKRVAKEKFDDVILIHMPHYVLHGSEHSESIEKLLHEFLSAHADKLKLNDYEKFLLISAIWLHDIGMIKAKEEGEDWETIREEHHERSRDMILDSKFQEMFGLNRLEGDIVATISLLHRRYEDIQETLKRYEELTYDGGTSYYGKSTTYKKTTKKFEINIEMLAMLLRLLDACDRGHERAKDIDTIAKIAKLPKESVMHHYVQSLIDSVDFTGDEILLHSHIYGKRDRNMINELVCIDIKREIDSLEPLLKKYDLYRLSVRQVPSEISGTGLPKEVYEYYSLWRNTHQITLTDAKFRYPLIEKDVYISKSGHAIIEYKYDALVKDLIDSFPHSFSADESTPPNFKFSSLQTMEKEPLENRFTEQTFFYRILEHNLNEVSISAKERKDMGDPFRHKEFDLKFDKKLNENNMIKYGWGFSAPNFFNVGNDQSDMTSSYSAFCDVSKILFSISVERGLNTTELSFLVLDENDKERLCMKLDKPKSEYTAEGIFKYKSINNLVCRKHIIEIVSPEKKRSFIIQWRWGINMDRGH
jgi:hypothetical protein